jgi:hypothetical protein
LAATDADDLLDQPQKASIERALNAEETVENLGGGGCLAAAGMGDPKVALRCGGAFWSR